MTDVQLINRRHEAEMKDRLTLVHPVDVWRSGAFGRVAGQDDAFSLVSYFIFLLLFQEDWLS